MYDFLCNHCPWARQHWNIWETIFFVILIWYCWVILNYTLVCSHFLLFLFQNISIRIIVLRLFCWLWQGFLLQLYSRLNTWLSLCLSIIWFIFLAIPSELHKCLYVHFTQTIFLLFLDLLDLIFEKCFHFLFDCLWLTIDGRWNVFFRLFLTFLIVSLTLKVDNVKKLA